MSIPLILASKSKPRRDLLFNAGICPTIRVSHVDEDKALAQAAQQRGMTLDAMPIRDKVMILASAKAQAVAGDYRQVIHTAAQACGTWVSAYPLRAQQATAETNTADTLEDTTPADTQTRDFSGITIPTAQFDLKHVLAGKPSLLGGTAQSGASARGPLILGCDSMFLLDGIAYGKPHTADVARERLRMMSGSTGQLWTGHCLIDLGSGQVASGASCATIHFAEFTEMMIDRYIATGEPLEVAGSFTLDGFGGAYVDAIEGDPSGIVGLSLPLARQLAEQLGYDWTDLWNVARDDRFPGAAESSDSLETPKENVNQPGDGWVDCACGRRHWGTNGAAGVLLARRDAETGEPSAIVMQHRAAWSAEGGTWGVPGGAIADGESPIEGALRESFEEANITPADIEVVGTYCEDHGPWSYTTVFAFETPGHQVVPRANDDESLEIEWIDIDDVPKRKLLTALRADWPRFERRLHDLADEYRGI